MTRTSDTVNSRRSRALLGAALVLGIASFAGTETARGEPDEAFPGHGVALLNGDLNGDRRRDVSDPIHLLSHLFAGGPRPVPLLCLGGTPRIENGDSNGNGQLDISDTVHLLTWLFGNGSAPVTPCGRAADGRGGITFGEPDGDRHPNVGAIVLDLPPGLVSEEGFLTIFCSGTLIDGRVFLTAGHCTDVLEFFADDLASRIYVSFSSDSPLDPVTLLPVAEVHTHPEYRPVRGGGSVPTHDIGALVLSEPVGSPTPAALAPEGLLDGLKRQGELRPGPNGTKFNVVGYGASLDWPPPAVVPGDGVRKVSVSEYRALNRSWLTLSQNQATGDGGTGFGDSGGPTFYQVPDGTEVIVSITSRGDPKLVATGVTYRIDTARSLGFLDALIESLP